MTPQIDRLPNDGTDPNEVKPRPRRAGPERIERVEAEPAALEVGFRTEEKFPGIKKNEDAVLVDEQSETYGVLDGMGGHAAGEIASSRASEFIRGAMRAMPDGLQGDGEAIAAYLQHAVAQAGGHLGAIVTKQEEVRAQLKALGKSEKEIKKLAPSYEGMGTTCSIMHVLKDPDGKPKELVVAQVGDSRVYRLRGGKLERITQDQSLIQRMIDTGHRIDGRPLPPDADQVGDPEVDARMTKEQRTTVLEQRNVVAGWLGDPNVRIDVTRTPIEAGDVFIAISDGVGDCLIDREIEAIARQHPSDPVRISEALVAAARERVEGKETVWIEQKKTWFFKARNDALLARGKDDDRSAVAIRIAET